MKEKRKKSFKKRMLNLGVAVTVLPEGDVEGKGNILVGKLHSRWNALDNIYNIHILLQFSDHNVLVINRFFSLLFSF